MSGSTTRYAGEAGVSDPHRRDERLLRDAVGRTKRGDRAGLGYLYLRFHGEVYRYVVLIVRDHHEAEDITHDVFARLTESIQRYEPQSVPFGGWIIRVARNASIDHLRAHRVLPTEDLPREESSEPTEPATAGAFRAALAELPPDQREVIVLRHIVGLSPPEIAKLLGRSESSVHALHNRGRRTIKARLAALGAAPAVRTGTRAKRQPPAPITSARGDRRHLAATSRAKPTRARPTVTGR